MSSSSEKQLKSISSSNQSATEFLLERFEALEKNCQELTESIKQVNDELQALRPALMEIVETNIPTESQTMPFDKAPKSSAISKKKSTTSAKTNSSHEDIITEPLFPLRTENDVPKTGSSKADFINEVNTLPLPELEEKLTLANAKKNVIKNILNERKKLNFQRFESMDDIVRRIKGLAEHSLEKITEQWS
jgi:2-hydroxy-3-keto-5-methylthiopentenyl-1-phosphate phosphatase